jgi:hypothetical protein
MCLQSKEGNMSSDVVVYCCVTGFVIMWAHHGQNEATLGLELEWRLFNASKGGNSKVEAYRANVRNL